MLLLKILAPNFVSVDTFKERKLVICSFVNFFQMVLQQNGTPVYYSYIKDLVNLAEQKTNNVGGTVYEGGIIDLPDEVLNVGSLSAYALVSGQRVIEDRVPQCQDEKRFLIESIQTMSKQIQVSVLEGLQQTQEHDIKLETVLNALRGYAQMYSVNI